MAVLKVYNGATWDEPVLKFWDGSSWVTPDPKFYDGSSWISLAVASGPTVDMTVVTDLFNFKASGTCQANVKCDNDADWYESAANGTYGTSEGTYLTAGLVSEVWVERTITAGTLSTDAGSGRLSCSTDRIFGVSRSSTGSKNCTITIEFWDAASGGSSLGSKSIVLDAERL